MNDSITTETEIPETLKNRFYIVNRIDRPCETLIAEKGADGKLYYIHPCLRESKCYHGMSADGATPLEHFNITVSLSTVMVDTPYFQGELHRGTLIAKYPDGRPRKWQGSNHFSFYYSQNHLRTCSTKRLPQKKHRPNFGK